MSEPFWCQIPRRVGAKRLLYVEAFAPVMNALFFCVISARLGFETSTVLVQTIRAKCMVGTGSGGAKRSFKIRWVQTLISRDARCNQETADHNKAPQPKHSRLVLAQEYFHEPPRSVALVLPPLVNILQYYHPRSERTRRYLTFYVPRN